MPELDPPLRGETSRRPSPSTWPGREVEVGGPGLEAATEARPTTELRMGELVVVKGPPHLRGQRFPIPRRELCIGRAADCDVCLDEGGVSRRHARIVWEGGRPVLVHESATNVTLLNGTVLASRDALAHGDEIHLADQVVLRVEMEGGGREQDVPARAAPAGAPAGSMLSIMEQYQQLEQLIEERYIRHGSFVDIDVVNSSGMKGRCDRTHHVVVSFKRFRAYLEAEVARFGGRVLNSNGDELMCFFEDPGEAVSAAIAIVKGLEGFNRTHNLMPDPFRVRVGVHTGRSTLDLEAGVAYSAALDVAGHLQKEADVNGVLISESTWEGLQDPPFAEAAPLPKEGLRTFRFTG